MGNLLREEDLEGLSSVIRESIPDFKVLYKEDSRLQRAIGYLMRVFNPEYMTKYTSTFYPVVYFPSKDFYLNNPRSSFIVLAHEYIHLLDTKENPLWFRWSYVFPQILGVFGIFGLLGNGIYIWSSFSKWPLLGYFTLYLGLFLFYFWLIFSVVLTKITSVPWAFFFLFLALIPLIPWPSYFRVIWEMRGYAMSIAVRFWLSGKMPHLGDYAKFFTGPSYYFMLWPFFSTSSLLNWYVDLVDKLQNGELAKEKGYKEVYDYLKSRGCLYTQLR